MLKYFFLLSILVLLASSCSNKQTKKEVNWSKSKSIQMNKKIAQNELLDIKMYIENRKIQNISQSGSGLFYSISPSNLKDSIKKDMEIGVSYKISFLNGNVCYQTPEDELDYFKVDKSDVESGVQEGVKKMCLGDKAILIIPSHLAHGISGDNNKIPPLTPIVAEIKIVEIVGVN
jgi:FKBP-type peptidyl-prolyl cis-trans isomerase